MPFLFLVAGVVMVVAGARGTNQQLVQLLKGDFTGRNNFIYWTVAILIIGAVGYIPDLKPVSRAFLVLVVVVLFLKAGNPNSPGGGVFQQFTQAIGTTQQVTQPTTTLNPAPIVGAIQ